MSPMIELINISKEYPIESTSVRALYQVNLSINQGEFVALMGPSGSGKSTLMHILGLLDQPSEGSYFLENKDISRLNNDERARLRNQRIGFIFQNFNLLPRANALSNAALPLLYGQQSSRWQEAAQKALQRVGLSHRSHHRPGQMSGGERQRVAIARALVTCPALILADEPTGNLDSKTGDEIMRLLCELNTEGHTLLIVTHDAHVAAYAQRTIRMVDGQIVSESAD